MRRVRQRDTAPELAVRKYLYSRGVRYRVCPSHLPARPDLVNQRAKWAVLVHGCYWHGHMDCSLFRIPKTNSLFWRHKIAANRERDARKQLELEALGFEVHVVWQCEVGTARLRRLANKLKRCMS